MKGKTNPSKLPSTERISAKNTNGIQSNYIFFPFLHLKNQCWVLTLICILFYGNTIFNEYAVDDGMVIAGNKFTKKGLAGIKDLLTKDSFLGTMDKNVLPGGRYRPLSYITFAIEWEFFSTKKNENGQETEEGNPFMSHLINIGIYILSLILLLKFLRRSFFADNHMLAFISVVIFAIHPIHIECITNLKGRDELLALLFMIISMQALWEYFFKEDNSIRPIAQRPIMHLVIALLTYFLALLSKENPVTFVAIIPLALYCFSDLQKQEIIKATGFYLGVTILYILIRVGVSGIQLDTLVKDVFQEPYLLATKAQKYATIIYVLGLYLKLLFFPYPLSFDYSYQQIPYIELTNLKFIVSFLIYAALGLYGLYGIRKKNIYAFCILFYLISISIVSNIVFNLGGVMGERFLYQASLGFSIAIAALLIDATQKLSSPTVQKVLTIAFLGTITLVSGAWTIKRNRDWKSNETLYIKDVEYAPNSAKANKCAGEIYLRQGMRARDQKNTELATEKLNKAVHYLKRSIKIYPDFEQGYLDLAASYHFLGKTDSAESVLKIIEKKFPGNEYSKFYYSELLAPEFAEKGVKAYEAKDYDKAIDLFTKAAKYRPNYEQAYYYLGHVYGSKLQLDSATTNFERAVKINPKMPDYWFNLGGASLTKGDYKRALEAFDTTYTLKPDYPQLDNARRTTINKMRLKQ